MDKNERKKFLVEKFREKIEKDSWHDNEDIYELDDVGQLRIYGHNGLFYIFNYVDDGAWSISKYPKDFSGKKIWHGLGKGWEDV